MKLWVLGLPSARFAKLRLKEVIIEFGRSEGSASRFHCPIHGPQALAITTPPTDSNSASTPSLSAVYRTNSEPGLMMNCAFTSNPSVLAFLRMEAARVKSS